MSSSRARKSRRSKAGKLLGSIVPAIVKPITAAADRAWRRPDTALRRELERRALHEAADIVGTYMPDAMFCHDRLVNLEYALTLRATGLILEFGVAGGRSINHIAGLCSDEKVFGFDSFRGLPEHWSGNRFSFRNFDQQGRVPDVPSNVQLFAGWFSDTLPTFLAEHPEQVGFLHVDCDIYSSTQYVLETLASRLQPGCVVVFDEFFNYPGYRQHEYRAFFEFVENSARAYRFVSFAGQQAAVALD